MVLLIHIWANFQHKVQDRTCVQWRFKSVCTSTQSDQKTSFPPKRNVDSWLLIKRPLKTQISLRWCAGWSESSLGAHANLYLFLETESILIIVNCTKRPPCYPFVNENISCLGRHYHSRYYRWIISAFCCTALHCRSLLNPVLFH